MDAGLLSFIGLGWWAAASTVQWASAALARSPRPEGTVHHRPADFSVVAPMNGVGDASAAYVAALKELGRQGAEILICVSHAGDGAIAATRALWREAPFLIGSDTTFNPKMNNVRKGLEAARRPVVALCDAGIVLDADTLCRAAAPLSDSVGLVLALKAGETPENLAAELERAYINGHQARFLLAADRLGLAVASGGVTFPEDLLQVIESITEPGGTTVRTHAHWFGTTGTPSHFALNATGTASTPATRIEAVFPEPVQAAGFLYNCFDCSTSPFKHGFVWTTRDADGQPIEQGTIVVDEPTPAGAEAAKPGFVGITTTKPFRRLSIQRMHPFNAVQRWVIDDVRYATTLPAIEYHHAAFDHYFASSLADELTKLDEGTFGGWTRTGLRFNVGAPGATGTNAVCRLFSTAFGAKSSHFYSSDAAECELRKTDPHWQYEGMVFGLAPADASGACAGDATPLYRLYNNGQGGAPNHRYTPSLAARQAMVDAGWTSEGAGALGVIGCVAQ